MPPTFQVASLAPVPRTCQGEMCVCFTGRGRPALHAPACVGFSQRILMQEMTRPGRPRQTSASYRENICPVGGQTSPLQGVEEKSFDIAPSTSVKPGYGGIHFLGDVPFRRGGHPVFVYLRVRHRLFFGAKRQCDRAPPTGLRFTYAGFTVAGDGLSRRSFSEGGCPGTGSPRNRSSCFQFPAEATTFHRVGEFTPEQNMRTSSPETHLARIANHD
jgi:hypothetical protein